MAPNGLSTFGQGTQTSVDGPVSEQLLNTQQLIVFGGTVGSAQGAGLDLSAIGGDGKIGDGGILRLTGAVGKNGSVAVFLSQFDGIQRFGQGTDLVDLDEDGVGGGGFNTTAQEFDVGNEQIVTD